MELKPGFATQAGHWYTPDGSPAYEIIGANGRLRNTTLRDAKKLGLRPSVTTILKVAAAPGLVNWQKEQVARAAYGSPRQEGEDEASYVSRILSLGDEKASEARDRGTAIHAAVEQFYLGKLAQTAEYAAHAYAAQNAVFEWSELIPSQWSAERSFCHPTLPYGGKLDLSAPGYVLDFKTTDKPLEDLKVWPDHRRQLGAYREGLGLREAKCAIVYVSSVEPKARVMELSEDEVARGWREFQKLLEFWVIANEYPT